jgi:3D (Asp-Asp-Asp) domain-containing protein/peptidoglycan hydrolase CwlO-like protein
LRVPTRIVGRLTLSLLLLVLLALPTTSGADRVGRLRAARSALAAREQAALLQLYSLNTSLDRARARVAVVEAELADARRRRNEARIQLRVAQRSLALAQSQLGRQVRTLYEQPDQDVLAVIFGATSLDEIITGLDSLSRTATSTNRVIVQTRHARRGVVRQLRALTRKATRLSRLRSEAAARADELVRARADRSAYIVDLRTRERLTGRRIVQLEAKARTAEAASTVATVKAQAQASLASIGTMTPSAARPPAPPAPAAAAPIQPASGSGLRLTVVATAYSLHGGTASGLPTGPGVVAVDPTVIPLGTRMEIPGYGPGIAADTGTAIKGLRIDLWFPTLKQTYEWGRRTVTITLR